MKQILTVLVAVALGLSVSNTFAQSSTKDDYTLGDALHARLMVSTHVVGFTKVYRTDSDEDDNCDNGEARGKKTPC